MGLLGNGYDDPRSAANMALAAGMIRGDLGGGLLGANQAYGAQKNDALKAQLVKAQMDNYASEVEARKLKLIQDQRQQAMMESLFPGMTGGGAPSATMGVPGSPAATGAAPSPVGAQATPAAGGNDILSLSQHLGLPVQAIQADLVFNGGKKISEMLAERSKPNWQNINGNLVNTAAPGFQGGFQPGMSASSDGRVTAWQPDGQGGLVVGAPRGALDTYGAYQNIGERSKAQFDPVTITPSGSSTPVMRSRLNVMQEANTPAPQPGMTGAFVGSPEAVAASIAGIRDPQERANAQAAFEAQMRQTGGKLPAAGGGVALADPTVEAARKEQLVTTAKDVADQRKAIMNAGFSAPTNIAKYQQIGKLLADVDGGKYTPAGTELASALNSLGIKVDKNLPNKQAAMSLANEAALQLRSPSGGAGMPGAMSDQDRVFLASMTPNISQSAEGRKMVIDAYVAVQQRNQQVAQFARNYEKKYGKLDNGFFDQLQMWSNTNPLFGGK